MKVIVVLIIFCGIGSAFAQNQNPCANPKLHEFDFWVGDWNVYKYGTDTLVGQNLIKTIVNGCAISENWQSAGGGVVGTSINKYAFAKQKWQQMWVDNAGQTLFLEGNYADGKMILENEQLARDGKTTIRNKVTWFNNADSTVRQYWQQSADGGQTWRVAFDGHYKKK
jgi:hypothetical protein